jgi:hypothetical protein
MQQYLYINPIRTCSSPCNIYIYIYIYILLCTNPPIIRQVHKCMLRTCNSQKMRARHLYILYFEIYVRTITVLWI